MRGRPRSCLCRCPRRSTTSGIEAARTWSLSTINQRFSTAVGVSLENAEAAWTTMLKAQ
jgi:hypothetical protein